MKTILSAEEKQNTNEIFDFIKTLDAKEENAFSVFIKGFELGKQIGANTERSA